MDKPEARMLGRFFIAGAIDAEVDKQGRILLPANLLQHAGIEKEAVMTTEISNSGESRSTEVGDGKGISEGEGALITAFNGGYNDVNESQKKDVKPEREQK